MKLAHAIPILAGTLPSCASAPPGEPPSVVIENAHSRGAVVAFAPSGKKLASGGQEGNIQIWALPEGTGVTGWRAHDGGVRGLAMLSGGRLISAGYDGSVAEWEADGRLRRRVARSSPVGHMVADETTGTVVSGYADGYVRIWHLPEMKLMAERRLHRGPVRAVAWHGATRQAASSGRDGQVHVWRAGGEPERLEAPPTDAWSLVFGSNGRELFGGGWFDLFRWDLETGRLTVLSTPHWGVIKGLDNRDGGRVLASISRQTDSSVHFLDSRTGKVVQRFQAHELCGADVKFSPGGRYLATTSDDASVRIWQLKGRRRDGDPPPGPTSIH